MDGNGDSCKQDEYLLMHTGANGVIQGVRFPGVRNRNFANSIIIIVVVLVARGSWITEVAVENGKQKGKRKFTGLALFEWKWMGVGSSPQVAQLLLVCLDLFWESQIMGKIKYPPGRSTIRCRQCDRRWIIAPWLFSGEDRLGSGSRPMLMGLVYWLIISLEKKCTVLEVKLLLFLFGTMNCLKELKEFIWDGWCFLLLFKGVSIRFKVQLFKLFFKNCH